MSPRVRNVLSILAVGLVLGAGLALLSTATAGAQADTTPATPTCPAQAAYNPATGNCERPAIAQCPVGASISGSQCTAPGTCRPGSTAPDRGTCTDPNAGPLMYRVSCPGGMDAIGNSSTCTSLPVFVCPPGQVLGGATCSSPPTWTCAAGATLSGRQCIAAPKPPAPVAAPAAPKPVIDAPPAAAAPRGGMQLAATGRTTLAALGVAGLAFVFGGALLLVNAPPRRGRRAL